jgi:hypothetical protein
VLLLCSVGVNKGGVAVGVKVGSTSLAFIGSHLAAHQSKTLQRNRGKYLPTTYLHASLKVTSKVGAFVSEGLLVTSVLVLLAPLTWLHYGSL